jgi:DNA-binding NarL/FixJ family response regulator
MMQSETPLTIFTVDDSEIVYRNIGSIINQGKNSSWVGHAFTIADAYKQIAEKKPDIVILDIQLKEGTSFELLEHLTKNYPAMVVIMFTNIATEPYREKSKKLGAKYFLDKSTEFEKIPQILEELLQTK